mgnify:CR=1 FL=1
MSDKTIVHVHHLDKTTKIILAVATLAIIAHLILPFNPIKDALAESSFSGFLYGGSTISVDIHHSGNVRVD